MNPIQTGRPNAYTLDRQAQTAPVDHRFTQALASTMLRAPQAEPQAGFVSNLSRYQYNCYGGNLDITA